MNVEIVISLWLFCFQQIQATEICLYNSINYTTLSINCDDACCSYLAASPSTACCSSISWGSIAIPFFVITGVCIIAVCLIYCRPFWKIFLCGCKCPCGNRRRVASPVSVPPNDNPVYVVNNDDLPDYDTIIKDATMKDVIPPPYNFVTAHPNDFGIDTRIPSAPPQYQSRRSSIAMTNPSACLDV